MTEFVNVAKVSAVSPGTTQVVEVGNQRLLLVNLDGEIYALATQCPHQDGPLEQGMLWGNTIECPWHHYLYDVRTGVNVYPRNVYPADLTELERDLQPVRCYPSRVVGDEIFVDISGGSP